MFNSLTGTITEKTSDQVCVDTAGVEWAVAVSAKTAVLLPPVGERARVLVYLHHKEDSMVLYGFGDKGERQLFLELLKVSGIGPKQALKILSFSTVPELVAAFNGGDVEGLARIPGLGKKTAQKLILALGGKLVLDTDEGEEGGDPVIDLVNALGDMGFEKKRAKAAVAAILKDNPTLQDHDAHGELLRRAIMELSG
jgi:Holliday junction DNA helicase RuvA